MAHTVQVATLSVAVCVCIRAVVYQNVSIIFSSVCTTEVILLIIAILMLESLLANCIIIENYYYCLTMVAF